MTKSKLTTALLSGTVLISWTCWESGKSYGRKEESKFIELAKNVQAYETEWMALYHLSILDYDEALANQRQKFDKALDNIISTNIEVADRNLKRSYVDRIVSQHPDKINQLPRFNELREVILKSKAKAEQDASSNH